MKTVGYTLLPSTFHQETLLLEAVQLNLEIILLYNASYIID